jgi:hypothetical protein
MMKKKLIALIMIVMSLSLTGQQSMFKALFMFNFAKYIEWPGQSNQSEFIIGIYGKDDSFEELKKLASTRKINNKTIIVKSVGSPSELPNANLFFIPTSKSSQLAACISFFADKPTLIVSEIPNACKQGAGINYIMKDGKMKYEISKANIVSHQLNVDQKLIALGIEVN